MTQTCLGMKKEVVAVMAEQFLSEVNSEDQARDKRAPHHPVALMIVRCYNTKTVKQQIEHRNNLSSAKWSIVIQMINYAWQGFQSHFYKALLLFVSRQGFKESEQRELLGRVWSFLGFGHKLLPHSSGLPPSWQQCLQRTATLRQQCVNEDLGSTWKLSLV